MSYAAPDAMKVISDKERGVVREIIMQPIILFIIDTRRVPVEGKSSVCLICMKYRIIILIIIIISLGQIVLSYIANTSRTHACQRTRATHARVHTHTPPSPQPNRLALFIAAHP